MVAHGFIYRCVMAHNFRCIFPGFELHPIVIRVGGISINKIPAKEDKVCPFAVGIHEEAAQVFVIDAVEDPFTAANPLAAVGHTGELEARLESSWCFKGESGGCGPVGLNIIIISRARSEVCNLNLMMCISKAVRIWISPYNNIASRDTVRIPGDDNTVGSYLVYKRTLGDGNFLAGITVFKAPVIEAGGEPLRIVYLHAVTHGSGEISRVVLSTLKLR